MDESARDLRALQARIEELERGTARASTQRQAFAQVRDAIWFMLSSDDLHQLIQVVSQALTTLEISFKFCGVNIVDPEATPALVVHNMTNSAGEIHVYEYADIADRPLVHIWREQEVSYRRDLQEEDRYGEAYMLKEGIRSVIDIPFPQGTLAVSSVEANAFSNEDIEVLQYLAGALSGGFRRLEDLRRLEEHNRALESEITERRLAESTVNVSLAVQRVRNVFLRMESEEDWDYVVLCCQREIKNLLDFDGFGINFVDMETDTFYEYEVGDNGDVVRGGIYDLPAAMRETIKNNVPFYRRNVREMEECGDEIRPNRLSILDMPFNGGTIAINSAREDAFRAEDIGVVQEFAQVISEANRRLQDIQLLDSRERQLRQGQMMEAIGQLTAGIAHNFNNMLQGIMGNIYLATQEAVSDPQREMLDSADTAARRAAVMVRQLLTFSHPGSQRRLESIDPGTRLADVIEMGRRTFDRRIELTLEVAEDLPTIEVDSGQFEQVALNVLINARDAVMDLQERPPKIHVAMDQYIDPDDDLRYLRIRTTDNGTGMDADTRDRIFEPFFTTKPVDKGTGLGLSTVYSIVQKQGGKILCDSTPDEGTSFTILLYLPLEKEQAAAGSDASVFAGGTILVIDDEQSVRQSTMNILQYHGYEVYVASDGIEGVEMFSNERPDLVLLDLSMPRMSGREVFKEIRDIDPFIKVLLFTGYATDEEEFGPSVGVVHKPFMAADLVSAIAKTMQSNE